MRSELVGNVAKFYCLNFIEKRIKEKGKDSEFKILDLGCGTASIFVNLLKLYPQIYYIGVEPSKSACLKAQENLKRLNAKIVNMYAYDVYRMLKEKFDIIVSFSVLEHVYRRKEYFRSAKECLNDDDYFMINYDSGHFFSSKERLKNIIGPILARFGFEKYYQSRVKEQEFLRMIDKLSFKITDEKFFNTHLKDIGKLVPEHRKSEYARKWLEFEIWLNKLIEYDDSKAMLLRTRNFILTHK